MWLLYVATGTMNEPGYVMHTAIYSIICCQNHTEVLIFMCTCIRVNHICCWYCLKHVVLCHGMLKDLVTCCIHQVFPHCHSVCILLL